MATLTVDAVVEGLGYSGSADLVTEDRSELSPARRHVWVSARRQLGVHAAFFEGRLPVVYFRGVSIPDEREVEREIESLQRRAWNESRARLLVVVLPTEVRILDAGIPPEGTAAPIAQGQLGSPALEPFTMNNLLRGRAADLLPSRTKGQSVIDRLRSDLRPARRVLIDKGLSQETANQLLARSLFARYLDARGLIDPAETGSSTFIDALNASPEATYRLFGALRSRFNGDTFRVSAEERRSVKSEHLGVIADLLSGTATHGQLTFLERYDFNTIPAETLGAVYEEFLEPIKRGSGAYYTPGHLVDASLDEVMPADDLRPGCTVLDPACGSGLFLARAYSRLLDAAEEQHGRAPTAREMTDILAAQVHGCDLMEDALRIAALSCYLVLLDRLTQGDRSGDWEFPPLVGRNFRAGDFFDHLETFSGPFDVIATNPPWGRLTEPAARYLEDAERPAGSRLPLAHAFYWSCAARIAPRGRMAILMPARSLYNQRPNERAFQSEALRHTGLDVIVDLSAFRFQLFSDAVAPCALFVVRGPDVARPGHLTFSAPKPGPSSATTGRITIDGDRITRVPRRPLARQPGMLRQLVFGDLRDVDLIDRLRRREPVFGKLVRTRGDDQEWIVGLGYQTVAGGSDMPLLRQIPSVRPDAIEQFCVRLASPIDHQSFHRPRRPELYDGPRVLLARGLDSQHRVRAAFLDEPASFSESVLAIRAPNGQPAQAKAICAYLNSRLARYLLLMTASSWGIERPELKAQDVRALPVPFLTDADAVARLSQLADAATHGHVANALAEIDELLARIFGVSSEDQDVIDDRLDVQLPAFLNPFDPAAYGYPTVTQLRAYGRVLGRALAAGLGTNPEVDVRRADGEVVATIGLDGPPPDIRAARQARMEVIGDAGGTIIVRRPIRAYGESWVAVTKLAEYRQVTKAAALHDADEIVSELLRAAVRRPRRAVRA